MDRRRERQIGGSIIALLAVLVLFWEIESSVQAVIAFAIVLTSFTLCGAIGVMCARLLAVHDKQPIAPSSIEGQFALLAGSVALFGILITGVLGYPFNRSQGRNWGHGSPGEGCFGA